MAKAKVLLGKAFVITDNLPKFDHNAICYDYTVDGHAVRGIHWSGRFDGPANQLVVHLKEMMLKYKADYITTTESQQPGVAAKARAALGAGYGVRQIKEYLLIFDKSVFTSMASAEVGPRIMTNVRNWTNWRQMHIGVFNIRHKATKRRFRIIDVHGPSGIEYGDGFKSGKASQVAKQGWPKLGKLMATFARTHPSAVQIVVGDSNGDHFLHFWLRWFQDQLGAVSVWQKKRPDSPTHDRRLIDGAWILL